MAMTLEQMADDLQAIIDGERPRLNKMEMREYVRDLRAHLTQPAQAVDVGAIREVIAELRQASWDTDCALHRFCSEKANTLTRAIAAAPSQGESA